MGIKTYGFHRYCEHTGSLKNLPTTWGLRPLVVLQTALSCLPLKNLPTTWGLRLSLFLYSLSYRALKNLPTTWGLRRCQPLCM